MGAIKSMVMDIESDIADGILSFGVIADKYGISRDEVEEIADRMYDEDYDDGQPDEAQEWYDFDPDC